MTTFSTKIEQRFHVETCYACGVPFAMTEDLYENCWRRKDAATFYCPNGHGQCYAGESDRKRIAELEAEKTALQARVNSERSRADEVAAKLARVTKRAAAGLCPYCHRSFATTRMQRHIHTKHPEKAHEK